MPIRHLSSVIRDLLIDPDGIERRQEDLAKLLNLGKRGQQWVSEARLSASDSRLEMQWQRFFKILQLALTERINLVDKPNDQHLKLIEEIANHVINAIDNPLVPTTTRRVRARASGDVIHYSEGGNVTRKPRRN